jgi:hypothetical protein
MKVKLNRAGMAQMLNSAGVRREVNNAAQGIAETGKSFAPVLSGAYKDSIEVIDDTTDRAVSRVTVGVDYALEVEAKHAPLGRAANAGTGA